MLDPSTRSNNLPSGIRAGDVIANRYRLEEVVGRGGMGVVVSARHLELDERVAVKFMSPDALSDPEAIARFDREAKASARIKSEYVARVYDAGKLPDGRRFMVLEYLEGEDLSVRVHRDGPLSPEQAVRFLLQACSALLDAHGLGIIHRDLKPANLRVVLRADGSEIVKVLDFGILKRMPGARTETDAHETQPGTIVGTPYYTSPEQLRGSMNVDARSDVWSLGATLFELLTGAPPFGGKTFPQVIANVLESPPNSLRALRPEISEELEAVVVRCLEKDPDDRYPSIIDFAKDLACTIELDAELRGLLERMLRHQRSSPVHTPVKLDLRTGDGAAPSAFAPMPSGQRRDFAKPVRSRSTKEYQPHAGRRLVLTSAAALLTAVLVIAVGIPLLPEFSRTSPATAPPSNAPRTVPTTPTVEAPESAALLTSVPSPESTVPTATPAGSTVRRVPKSGILTPASASTRISAPPPPASANPALPTSRPKNPLLVKPR